MKKLKNIKKIILSVVCGFFMLCMGISFVSINCGGGIAQTEAIETDEIVGAVPSSSGYKNIGDLLVTNYTSVSKKFNGYNLGELYKQITGRSTATFANVSALAPTGTSANWRSNIVNSATFRANNKSLNGTTYGNDIQLTFAGQAWQLNFSKTLVEMYVLLC